MPRSTIIFRVPQDFTAVQAALSDFPGECDRLDYEQLGRLDEQLRELIGEMIQIDFDEPHDPSDPIDRLVAALTPTDQPYLASHESYTEPSRNTRFQARIFVSTPGVSAEKNYPWHHGEPDITDRATFHQAGFSEQEIRTIDDIFFPDGPAPSVRA